MVNRLEREKFEYATLSPFATKSAETKGRIRWEDPCNLRTDFQRDRDRILHCKSFRRLAHKTQVFISPEGDHYRTRLTHTLEVAQIARTIARALSLNEDLTEAIALGHDLGHTPFGHTGEQVLQQLTDGEFSHNKHSLRVVEVLENNGQGLNLTFEVKDGILNHPTSASPCTLEGKVVQLADKIAYINHDIDDAIRGKVLLESELPRDCTRILGQTSSERLAGIVQDIVHESDMKNDILMSREVREAFYNMREFLFKHVYVGSVAKEQEGKAKRVISELYQYYMSHLSLLPEASKDRLEKNDTEKQIVCDYIAGMTDRYAVNAYRELFFPKSWHIY
ncbi:MAG: deoxyguanosinetriphosphate triphosphohydrolase [Cellulosilyticum sp.]|nr:deoxyguanosinetriphosphate triphosphohydrolase [Cellulosilyticum sp.]